MIVKYIWHTDRYRRSNRERISRVWEGWFLLGFIPLYVRNTNLKIS